MLQYSSFPSPPQGSDRLGRLTRHILRQQSLYPLYPPAEGMCIDMEQAETHARLPCTPHVLVIPSDLRYFARVRHVIYAIMIVIRIGAFAPTFKIVCIRLLMPHLYLTKALFCMFSGVGAVCGGEPRAAGQRSSWWYICQA